MGCESEGGVLKSACWVDVYQYTCLWHTNSMLQQTCIHSQPTCDLSLTPTLTPIHTHNYPPHLAIIGSPCIAYFRANVERCTHHPTPLPCSQTGSPRFGVRGTRPGGVVNVVCCKIGCVRGGERVWERRRGVGNEWGDANWVIHYLQIHYCNMYNTRCNMYNTRCNMYNTRCNMYNTRCNMYNTRCNITPPPYL